MSIEEKQKEAFEKLRNVYEDLLGIDRNEITLDKILAKPPEDLKPTDPSYSKYLGMDDVNAIISMLYIEQAFNKDIEDVGFVPLPEALDSQWCNQPIENLVNFCVATLMD